MTTTRAAPDITHNDWINLLLLLLELTHIAEYMFRREIPILAPESTLLLLVVVLREDFSSANLGRGESTFLDLNVKKVRRYYDGALLLENRGWLLTILEDDSTGRPSLLSLGHS
ncbi:MAG: hypothetical protein P4L67_02520 [Candidatus Pacebacteria bacterium]|nr:hypothetical protein [Candidatus Paceibacterota bacterium]